MNLLVIDRADSWHVADLKRASANRHSIYTATYEELSVEFDSVEPTSRFFAKGVSIGEFDAIITRAMPGSSLEQIVFRMDWLHQVEQQLKIPVVNPAKTIESSVDKYLSLEKMRCLGLPVPASSVSQSASEAIQFFERLGCDSVVKPIFGSRGRQIFRVRDHHTAFARFQKLESAGSVIYQQEFIDHNDFDLRILVIGERTFGMRRIRPGHWITNANLGARCEPHCVSDWENDLAQAAAQSQGAILAGIDIVTRNEQPYIVEVNASPSWKSINKVVSEDLSNELLCCVSQLAKP